MSHDPRPDELACAEYAALRATIAARGHLRFGLVGGGLVAWAALLLAVLAWLPQPVLAVIPLLVLIVVFEALRSLHFGVERIGRYLLVFFEDPDGKDRYAEGPLRGGTPSGTDRSAAAPPAWERAVARVGGRLPGAAGHPLFIPLFLLATMTNLLAVALPGPIPEEWIPLGLLHAGFAGWMVYVDRGVRAQRAHDEARFREVRDDMATKGTKITKN